MDSFERCRKFSLKKLLLQRVPIFNWLPNYKKNWILQDVLAGITVGLTAIPQGIAYGIVAGLGPEYGLYASFMASFVYIIFGSCKNITIGPTAIMAVMIRPLVLEYGADMAVLMCFLKGVLITLVGVFHLGFLLDFISFPVITGFMAAAAISIASSQLKPLVGISGSFLNFSDYRLWDIVLGISTIGLLILMKNISCGCKKLTWMIVISRNALVVILGALLAFLFYVNELEPFKLTGIMTQGLPSLSLPPFSTQNGTIGFLQMTKTMGTSLFTVPIISTIEHIALAKAFSMGRSLDVTQEMLALGICNIMGSFVRSMPVTGSFTRTAVNHASGVKSPLGGIFTGALVLLAAGLLTSTFRFIPKATLAGVIICAMYNMLDFNTYMMLWRAKKSDFLVMIITLLSSIIFGLEIGILSGLAMNLLHLLYFMARPSIEIQTSNDNGNRIVYVLPEETVSFPASENLRSKITMLSGENPCTVIFDCKNLRRIDVTVVMNMKLLSNDLYLKGQEFHFINCSEFVSNVVQEVAPKLINKILLPEIPENN
ncbi:sodium-independent sulfate anion transporter-like [Leptopilina boulardi]|uniref:sodium-independent sulfate anion transporter-like n=1 Tax=Leptopilina boulardi TaxID=63433 RepID=UPI0021F58045|nr:sodium-independent sulfate anion transporter-like [Leptopilina boulardi]XP_051175405.1 sodium-independent sulfate anion transporter-like [Leptopilina boulardi]XP_051175406.1 sodium-independent sulfate anion transporter-like [Leptopilina boulardi]XP_051175407.1 sodium-independent sulfate anion transporter-like [Leptopilina boulardi]XP_051175408.1 sodium-independent sulfate anion transporter-like [Leptopilina boulardi]